MNSINMKPTKAYPLAGAIRPQSVAAAGSVSTGWIAAGDALAFARITVNLGVLGGGSEAVKLEQAQDSGGTGAKDLETAANLGLSGLNTNNTDKEADYRIHENIDTDNNFTHFRATLTNTGGTGALVAVTVQYGPARYQD